MCVCVYIDFASSTLLASSSGTSSTSREEVDGANEKIVYLQREDKLREVLGTMQRNFDPDTVVTNGREARVRDHLKEMQDKSEERVTQAKRIVQEPVELDTTTPQKVIQDLMADDSSKRSLPPSNRTHVSTGEAQAVHNPPHNHNVQQAHAYLDLLIDIDDEFSAAIAQALHLSHLPELKKSGMRADIKAEEDPTELAHSRAEPIDPASCNCASAQNLPDEPSPEIARVLKPKLDNDAATSTAQGERIPSQHSATNPITATEPSQQIESPDVDDSTVPATMSLPLLESQAINGSVFSDLVDLVGASRRGRS